MGRIFHFHAGVRVKSERRADVRASLCIDYLTSTGHCILHTRVVMDIMKWCSRYRFRQAPNFSGSDFVGWAQNQSRLGNRCWDRFGNRLQNLNRLRNRFRIRNDYEIDFGFGIGSGIGIDSRIGMEFRNRSLIRDQNECLE